MELIYTSPALTMERVKWIERIIGKFLYYATWVYNTCIVLFITMETISDPTLQDKKNLQQFLDYMAKYPNAVVRFHDSDMILRACTNVSYLNESKSHSSAAWYFFLGSIPSKFAWEHLNGSIHANCNILSFCRFCCKSRNWGGFSDSNRCSNSTKHIIINRSPIAHYISMHGQYNSLWNCKWYNQATVITRNEYAIFLDLWPKKLKNFLLAWKSVQKNIADYFMNHYYAKHHKSVRPIYLYTDKMPRSFPLVLLKPFLKGCLDP